MPAGDRNDDGGRGSSEGASVPAEGLALWE